MDLKGKKVLITGACGFIGSHLVEELVKYGADVKALVYYNSFGNWGWLDTLDQSIVDEIDVVSGDIRSHDSVRYAVRGVEVIFNLAALIAIPYSYISPLSYIKTNIEGTLNVMQASLDFGIERVVQISTSETYGTAKYVPIDEGHPMQAQSPYSASKIGSDSIAYSFYKSFDLPVTIARPFNTYGPRQSARAIIPTVISQILSEKKEILLGSSAPTRDLTYVNETVKGLRLLSESGDAIGKTINIGSGKEISIGELALMIEKLCGKKVNFTFDVEERIRPKNSEVDRLLCDNSLLKELTKWQPSMSLEDGLSQTIEWAQENQKYYKSNIYNL